MSTDSNSARLGRKDEDRNPTPEKLEQKVNSILLNYGHDLVVSGGKLDEHVDGLMQLIQSEVASAVNEARIDQLKKDKETVNKLREIFITNDLPSLLTHADGATDEAIKNWNALRTMITRDFDKELEDLEAIIEEYINE